MDMTFSEATRIYKISHNTLRSYVDEGQLSDRRETRAGRDVRLVDTAALDALNVARKPTPTGRRDVDFAGRPFLEERLAMLEDAVHELRSTVDDTVRVLGDGAAVLREVAGLLGRCTAQFAPHDPGHPGPGTVTRHRWSAWSRSFRRHLRWLSGHEPQPRNHRSEVATETLRWVDANGER